MDFPVVKSIKKWIVSGIIAFILFMNIGLTQTVIVQQDFDGGTPSWEYTSDVAFFDHGWGSNGFLGMINISNASPLDYSVFSDSLLGENDLDDEGENGTADFATFDFVDIDISSYDNISLLFDWQIIGYNASNDDAKYELFYDSISQGEVFLIEGGNDPEDSSGSININIPGDVNEIGLHLMIRNDGVSGYSGFDNFRVISGVKPEPSNHATAFTATAEGSDQIDLTWNDNDGDQPADGFLIVGKTNAGLYYEPSDGIDPSEDSDWSDNNYMIKVEYGSESHSVNNLNSETAYSFKIYPYTNSGDDVDFKTEGTIPEDSATTEIETNTPNIFISEIMQDPDAVSDSDGEWFEIYNASGTRVDINDWIIKDSDSDNHQINNGEPLFIGNNDFIVLGRNADLAENGNVTIDYLYSGFTLTNSGDEIILTMSDDTEVDRVEYDGGTNWPNPTGASMVFTGNQFDNNNDYTNWTIATTEWSGSTGDKGSPGYNGKDQSLPIELISFKATFENGVVNLIWKTSSEIENAGFNIFKSAGTQENFYKINKKIIQGAGTTTETQTYEYQDSQIISGMKYFYKLEDVSLSGEKKFSRIISVESELETDSQEIHNFRINDCYPNPFNPYINIEYSIKNNLKARIIIYDIKGKLVKEFSDKTINTNPGQIRWYGKDNTGRSVSSGVYICQILSKTGLSDTEKIILIR
ncbi:MAG: lamin tail domain-containing protein [Candidatus Marinimicrobia bacterium]|nr:lamin tail domain-containing protein [Candidatus Neomarinimicrobiota bacterium]